MCNLTNTIKSPLLFVISSIWTDYTDIKTGYWEEIYLSLLLLYAKYRYFHLQFHQIHQSNGIDIQM